MHKKASHSTVHILLKICDLFLRYGVKSLTMDDIASQLGISKKTLYQIVDNKADLVRQALAVHINDERQVVTQIRGEAADAIDEMIRIVHHVSLNRKEVNPSVLFDLKKYYPDSYGDFQRYKNEFIYSTIHSNLENGIRQGLYREDLDADVVTRIYLGAMESILDPQVFSNKEYIFLRVYREFIRYHMQGIVSEKGAAYLKNLKSHPAYHESD